MLRWLTMLLAVVALLMSSAFSSPVSAALVCKEIPASPFSPPERICNSFVPSGFIKIPASQSDQYQSEWCWAASISMVFRYYHHPVSQERIVKEMYGRIENVPAEPWTMLQALNRSWVDDNGQRFSSKSTPGRTNIIAAAQDLANDKPLIIGTLGHAMVLTYLQYRANYLLTPFGPQLGPSVITNAVVRDPWPGNGRRSLSPQEWNSINFAVQIRVD